jgi:hypothetical protein
MAKIPLSSTSATATHRMLHVVCPHAVSARPHCRRRAPSARLHNRSPPNAPLPSEWMNFEASSSPAMMKLGIWEKKSSNSSGPVREIGQGLFEEQEEVTTHRLVGFPEQGRARRRLAMKWRERETLWETRMSWGSNCVGASACLGELQEEAVCQLPRAAGWHAWSDFTALNVN